VFELYGVGAGVDGDDLRDLAISLYSNRSLVRRLERLSLSYACSSALHQQHFHINFNFAGLH